MKKGYLHVEKELPKKRTANIPKRNDIIVYQTKEIETKTKEGMLIKKIHTGKNITKIMNETKKLIKQETAAQKLAEIEKVFTK